MAAKQESEQQPQAMVHNPESLSREQKSKVRDPAIALFSTCTIHYLRKKSLPLPKDLRTFEKHSQKDTTKKAIAALNYIIYRRDEEFTRAFEEILDTMKKIPINLNVSGQEIRKVFEENIMWPKIKVNMYCWPSVVWILVSGGSGSLY